MDAPPPSHYVTADGAEVAPRRTDALELLLFLTAMLAGLLSGDRTVDARQVEQAAVAAATVEAVAALVDAAEEPAAAPAGHPQGPADVRLGPAPADVAPRSGPRVDERRLE
jgi:hypothetical protein